MADITSTTAPVLAYYRRSMDIGNICTSTIRGGRIRTVHMSMNDSRFG